MTSKTALLLFFTLMSSCATTSFQYGKTPTLRFKDPYVVESEKSFAQVWSNLVDFIAVHGIPIALLDKENGLFVSETIEDMEYTFENEKGVLLKPNAMIVLPAHKKEDLLGNSVESSRTIHPNELHLKMNARVRPDSSGGTYININVTHILTKGAHTRKIEVNRTTKDTLITRLPYTERDVKWERWRSTGVMENKIADALK